MPTKKRLAVYTVVWVGVSAALYPLLPDVKPAPKHSVTTTVTPDTDDRRVAAATESPKKEDEKPQPVASQPTRQPAPIETKKKAEPRKQLDPQPDPPRKDPEPKKEPEPPKKAPEPKKEPMPEVLAGKERHLERPDGFYIVEPLTVRQRIKITGKVKKLTVNRVDGDSGLDASELEAEEIVVMDGVTTRSNVKLLAPNGRVWVRGNLDGDSQLEIKAPNGSIWLHGKVDTRSRLTIDAPDGRVKFTEPTVNGKEGSKIDGESKVIITARDVEFHGKIDTRSRVEVTAPDGRVTFAVPTTKGNEGTKIDGDSKVTVTSRVVDLRGLICGNNTRAFVTLTKDGELTFAQVDGGAYIGYKKANDDDPEPRIDMGRMSKKWQLRKME